MWDPANGGGIAPGVWGLLGMASGFGQAAMPQPYKGGVPFGAALGMGLGGFGQGVRNAYKTQLEQQQARGAQLANTVAASALPLTLARNKSLTDIWSNPDTLRAMMKAAGYGQDSSAPAQGPTLPVQNLPAASALPPTSPLPGMSSSPGMTKLPVTGIPAPALTTIKAPSGAPFRVAAAAAPAFQGLLGDLEAAGYKVRPEASGGYNDRFIAGTQTPSNHAFGTAIDINSDTNPRGEKTAADIPAPLANNLAQKWGLTWGGNWSGADRDPMHFELASAPAGRAPSAGPSSASGPDTSTITPGNAALLAQQYEARANQLEGQINAAKALQAIGFPAPLPPGDPATLREAAKQYRAVALAGPQSGAEAQAKANVQLKTAGPIAAAEANAKLGPDLASKGFRVDENGNQVPIPGSAADPLYIAGRTGAEAGARVGPELAAKGFRIDANGNQVPIPGSAADLGYVTGKAGAEKGGALAATMAEKGFMITPKGGYAPIPGGPADPAFVGANAAADAAAKAGVTLQTAGPIAGAEAAAKFPYTQERVSPGGVLAVGGKPAFSVPQRGEEVITTGPNTGMKGQVYRDPMSGTPIVPPEGSAAIPGVPPGFLPTSLAPNVEKRLEEIPKTQAVFIRDDKKIVEGDLENTIDSVNPVKQQLFQLRALAPEAATGAGGEWRAAFKNWVQTFAPNLTQYVGDASPSQEFKKIALMGAGKQERSDLGARGGFRAMELYLNANPNLEMQPTANRDMANALLVSAQYHRDYAEGASQFFNKNFRSVMDPQNPKPYEPLTSYDSAFIKKMTPELYSNAITAINGKPYATWAKGLAPDQIKIVGGILQRTDPNAVVDVDGKQRPVSAFTSTIGPFDIAPPERQ